MTTENQQQTQQQQQQQQRIVYSTWDEIRTPEFPRVLQHRAEWRYLGFEVHVTPTDDIRKDVIRLVQETDGYDHLIQVFDHLESIIMKYDFWRYTKLYLDGGLYADVDVKPYADMIHWQDVATDQNSVVLFEESPTWMSHSKLLQAIRPWVSNYQEFPSYANCLFISPGPRAPFFLDLLHAVNATEWEHTREPRKTLMTAGPGHLTRFVKQRQQQQQQNANYNDVIIASPNDRKRAYLHRGFGTWKPTSTLWFEKLPQILVVLALVSVGVLFVMKRRRKQAMTSSKASGDDEEERGVLLESSTGQCSDDDDSRVPPTMLQKTDAKTLKRRGA